MAGVLQADTYRQAADPAREPLVRDQEANHPKDEEEEGHNNPDGRSIPWLTILGFLFLTFNSIMAILRSQGDMSAILFVGFSYGDLVILFVCLRFYERAPAHSTSRERIKIAVWVLTTLLTLAFSYKVAAVMPPAVAVLVWLMAFATVAGGFVAFFLYKEKN